MARIYYRIDRLLLLLLIVVLDFHVLFNVDAGVADVGQKRNVTVALYSHKNVLLDITTLYRITDMDVYNDSVRFTDNGFLTQYNGSYSIEIHSRINTISPSTLHTCTKYYPAHKKLDIDIPKLHKARFIQNDSINVDFINPDYWRKIRIGLTGEKCKSVESSSDTNEATQFDKENIDTACYNALDYINGNHNYYNENQTFFTVQWTPTKPQTCLAITYFHRLKSDMNIIISVMSNVNHTLITSHTLEKHDDIKLLKISNMNLVQDQTYEIILKRTFGSTRNYYGFNSYFENWFGILRINQCSDDDEEITTVSLCENGEHPRAFGVLETEAAWNKTVKSSPVTICLNGGYEPSDQTSTCVCPPGFTGQFCEEGCGSNSYGADCKRICSMYKNKMCRGIFMCTKYGCTCPAGLTGPLCNDDCKSGTYGADCRQNCSSNCLTNICDQYTGICSEGCLPGYVPPNCSEKYPYLIKPPTLISDKYEELDLNINFQPDNVKGGDGTAKMKYYQIIYLTGDMNHFTRFRSMLKLITDNNNGTTDVLSNLKADTEHKVGVLLVMDDGNFNDQDIVLGKYMTSCIQPQDTNYHIKLITEKQSVKILWNKITPKRLECKIARYVLTLTLNQSQIEVLSTKEIISSTKSFHRIVDLYPGYEYNVKMTPETSMGPMQTSPTYSFTFPITDDDIKINNIVTTAENGSIKVSWQLGSSYKRKVNVNNPVTCVVKYKINRILSCSLKEIDQTWTSVMVFNRTDFEITNALPNAQYSIQIVVAVDKDINSVQHEKTVYVLTPETYPQTEPSVDRFYPPRITNSSVFLKWKINHAIDCSKLNGFISNFYVELLDTKHNLLQIRETKENHILFDDLNPNSSYELKVFIQTNVGYNPERFLFTKVENLDLTPIKDVMVYKKSRKYRMAGIRWSYSNKNTSFDGFLIELNGNGIESAANVSNIPPEKCSAWPEYYCYTFYNLDPNTQYKCSIKPKYLGVSEDLDKSLISFNCNDDQLPGSPKNLRSIDVGNTYATLQWDIPWIFNGILKGFAINGNEILTEDMDTYSPETIELRTVPFKNEVPSYNYNLTGLKPGSKYSIEVFSVISTEFIRLSPSAKITITTNNIKP